jgi:hypothetical protein
MARIPESSRATTPAYRTGPRHTSGGRLLSPGARTPPPPARSPGRQRRRARAGGSNLRRSRARAWSDEVRAAGLDVTVPPIDPRRFRRARGLSVYARRSADGDATSRVARRAALPEVVTADASAAIRCPGGVLSLPRVRQVIHGYPSPKACNRSGAHRPHSPGSLRVSFRVGLLDWGRRRGIHVGTDPAAGCHERWPSRPSRRSLGPGRTTRDRAVVSQSGEIRS